MLNILRDPKEPSARRDWAAEKAAPYIHPRLASTEARISGVLTLKQLVGASYEEEGKD
jgi:hypothetical protein